MENESFSEKSPSRVRRRFTPRQKHAILERFRASGLSQGRFVRREGIALATLSRWLRKERNEHSGDKAVEVGRLGSLEGSSEWAEVVRPDGWRIRLSGALREESLRMLFSSLPPCSR
jgi:transposase-like protein